MALPRTVEALPDEYREVFFLRVTERRKMLMLNLIAILQMAASLFVFVGLLTIYHALGAPLVIAGLPKNFSTPIGVAIVLAMMPLHEWVHGLAIRYFGHPVRYGVKILKGVIYATSDGAYFWRRQFIVIALAPLLAISLAAIVLGAVFPAGGALWIMFAAALNATGAAGDLWMVWAARRYPPDALIRDEEDGMRIFTRS